MTHGRVCRLEFRGRWALKRRANEFIEFTGSQCAEHRAVLRFHQLADSVDQVGVANMISVLRAPCLKNPTPVSKQVRHHAAVLQTGILRLDMKCPPVVLNVIIEPKERWGQSIHERQFKNLAQSLEF